MSNDGNYGLLTFRGVAGQNAFLVDGTDTTEQFYRRRLDHTRINSQISQDAVQEFQVVSSNYSAGTGGAMGGVVDAVTRDRWQPDPRHRILVLPQHGVQRARPRRRRRC